MVGEVASSNLVVPTIILPILTMVGEVASSNLVVPTIYFPIPQYGAGYSLERDLDSGSTRLRLQQLRGRDFYFAR